MNNNNNSNNNLNWNNLEMAFNYALSKNPNFNKIVDINQVNNLINNNNDNNNEFKLYDYNAVLYNYIKGEYPTTNFVYKTTPLFGQLMCSIEVFGELEKDKRFNRINFYLKEQISNESLYNLVIDLLKIIELPTNKGFILPSDLNFDKMEVFNTLIEFMILRLDLPAEFIKYKLKGKKATKKQLIDLTEEYNLELRKRDFIEIYKWLFNLILINLYLLLLKNPLEKGLSLGLEEESNANDFAADYQTLIKDIYTKIDPSIRVNLRKSGLNVIQNIYTGFDTEYYYKNGLENELLSAQLAVNTRTYLKVPMVERYEVCEVEPLKSIKRKILKCSTFRYDMFEDNVDRVINELRKLKYPFNDYVLNILKLNFLKLAEKQIVDIFTTPAYFVVSLPRTPIIKYIQLNEDNKGLNFKDLINVSNNLGEKYIDWDYERIKKLLNGLIDHCKNAQITDDFINILNSEILSNKSIESNNEIIINKDNKNNFILDTSDGKRYSRSLFRGLNLNVNKVRNQYVISHLTNADLSMLNDFNELKESLDIVNKSFITLGKPLNFNNWNVHIRDTMLLAPGGKKSLAALGSLMGVDKINLTQSEINNMNLLLKNDSNKFIDYAINDSVISLLYANYMEDENFRARNLGIPITLSSLSSNYVRNEWKLMDYPGYQINYMYMLGNSATTQTPKGLHVTGDIGKNISFYIANYKGGRNESFMYGIDKETTWFDYDLTSAYPTGMCLLGDPDYSTGRYLTEKEIKALKENDLNTLEKSATLQFWQLINSYLVLDVVFEFPSSTKYPSIPCYLNEDLTVYPLKGRSTITGIEYYLAKSQGCIFHDIKHAFIIQFRLEFNKDGKLDFVNKPFYDIICNLQSMRRMYPKGSIENLMLKEKANSIYGACVRGMSNKRKFDIKMGRTIRMEGSELSNPIIASWTTAFIRSVIGECLDNIHKLGGKIVSVTTDGFITDLDNLEEKILSDCSNSCNLLKEYRKIRKILSGDPTGLELKHSGKGIISWTTRGQFSIDSEVKAATGFQTKGLDYQFLDELFTKTLSGGDRIIEFVQSGLRSAKDIYLKGGHVTRTYTDRVFRMEFDNKRVLNIPEGLNNLQNLENTLLDSSPADNAGILKRLRFLGSIHKLRNYNKSTTKLTGKNYKSYIDLGIRNFIKGCLNDPPAYNLTKFKDYASLIEYIKSYKPDYKISKSSISHLKNRKVAVKGVPKTPETLAFVEFVKLKNPSFDEATFFK